MTKPRQRTKEIAQGVVTRRGIESDVRGDAWQHVITREEHAVAAVDEDGVIVSVARRPAELRRATAEVNAVAVVHAVDVFEIVDALAHRDPGLAHALVDVVRHPMAREPFVRRMDRLMSFRPDPS